MSITKLFQISTPAAGMKGTKETGSAVCELLLILFFLGALFATLRRAGVFGFVIVPTEGAAFWIAGVLAADAVMAGSLLAWYVLPVTTLILGAAASAAGQMRRLLKTHGRGRSVCAAALLLMLGTAGAAYLVYDLLQHGLI